VLKDYIMTGVAPEFPRQVSPGDIIVAGKNFGHGNPHIWGYHTLRELGIGLVVESMARGGFRLAVVAGVPFLLATRDITRKVNQGDELEVNFRTGDIKNLTSGELIKTESLPEFILEIIEVGGQAGYLARKLAPKLSHLTPSPIAE
jgi:3-isopropylmalate/(R)-2-methylmalate dehydratase small subunit